MEAIYREQRKDELVCVVKQYNVGISSVHWHENIEICQILDNKCRFFIDGKYINASPGDIIVFSEYAPHRFLIDYENTNIRICQFPISILLNVGVSVKPLKTHITLNELESCPGLNGQINAILDLMESEGRGEKAQNPMFSNLSAALYFALMRHFATDENVIISKKDRREFYKITEYINTHFTENITVSSIAKEFCVPRGKLSEIFTKFAETNITSYINNLRINYANQLVEDGSSITDAAYESGFQSMRTFNDVYRKIMKITPSEYLKRKTEK